MNKLLPKPWDKRARLVKTDRGFTLIELLVVVVILGVLIAIAIPLYLNYRKGANDSAAQSDLKNAINTLEQCNSTNSKYPINAIPATAGGAASVVTPADCSQAINLSSGTSFAYSTTVAGSPNTAAAVGAGGVSYVITDKNLSGTGTIYCYDSAKGGGVQKGGTLAGVACP